MKKLIIALSLLIPTSLFADSVTPGSVGLLIPSTGVIDTSRRWDAKINENFKIIAASLTTALQNTGGGGSTLVGYDEGTVQGDLTTLNVTGTGVTLTVVGTTGTLNVTATGGSTGEVFGYISTRAINMNGFGISRSTGIEVGGVQYTIYMATVDLRLNSQFQAAFSSISALGTSTQNINSFYAGYTSTADARMNGIGIVFSSNTNLLSTTNTWTATQRFSSMSVSYVVGFSSVSLSSNSLIIGTSDYSQGERGVFLTANPTVSDNGGNHAPTIKFITSGDNTLAPVINPVLSSFTIRMDVNSTTPQTPTTSRLKVMDVDNKEIASFNHGSGIRAAGLTIGDPFFVGTDINILNYMSTTSVELGTLKTWFSTNAAVNDAQNSTMTAIVLSTRTIENRLSTATLVYSGNIALTALVPGSNITFNQSGTSLTITGEAGSPGSGGAVQNSTIPIVLFHSGGPVFLATSPFVAIDGLAKTPVVGATFTVVNLRAYTMFPSSVAVTKFQIFKTTSTQGAFPFVNWGPQVHSSTASLYGVPISTTLQFYPTEGYSLGITSVPTSGDMSRTFGVIAEGWFTDSGGGGGTVGATSVSGGGVSLQSGGSVVSVSTFLFPGATITSDGQGASSVTFTPQILSTWTAFTNYTSTAQAVGISTQNIQSAFAVHASSLDFRLNSQFSAAFSSISALGVSTQTYSTFDNARASSAAVQIDSMSAVIGGIAVSTRANSSEWSVRITTTIGRDVFNVMNTTNSSLNDLQNSSATAFYNTINSTITAFVRSTSTLENRVSTQTLVYNGSINITAIAQGANTTLSVSGSTLTIAAASGGSGGGGGGFTFDGTNHVAFSTISAQTPYGVSPVNTGANNVSTFTVLGATNPYRSISIPAGAWVGCGISSASKINGGYAMTSTATAYNVFGENYHLFDAPRSTQSFVCTSFRMPFEWDGSSIAFSAVIHSTGLSGTTLDNLAGFSLGGVAISSGSSIYTTITSSVTSFTAIKSTNTDIYLNQSASYNILGSPAPGSRVKLWFNAGGGGYSGLPRMTEVLIWYRESVFDGRLR